MVKSTSITEIPKALFEDREVSINRGEYIIRYMIDDGKEVPAMLLLQIIVKGFEWMKFSNV